ncbi:hypothetical protein GCM10023196_097820 [Actinoallomurus vinaceus]|uniref:OmpR/PhoB-type domain-containing protein n=1 Tax=Actinoallomurus vinaceus TaxID=1080074 RepID=A0ABP8UTR1_9ACTN
MEFKILGGLEVADHGRLITPTAPKQRTVLALLLVSSNDVVSTGTLMEELWGEHPPQSAQTTLQTYIYQLRKLLGLGDGAWVTENLLLTRHGGYRLTVPDERIDLARFEHLTADGRAALERSELEKASELLQQALELWRGPALVDVTTGPHLEMYRVKLEEARIRATELRIECDMQMGRHHELIGELKKLTLTHRLNEWFHYKLMVALSRSGRRHEALEEYQKLRRLLVDELGVEPNPCIRSLQHKMLTSEAV